MKTYHVLENGKAATWKLCQNILSKRASKEFQKTWGNNIFPTFEEARKYSWQWIAPYGGSYDGLSGVDLKVGVPYDYSGYGDMIEIREVEE